MGERPESYGPLEGHLTTRGSKGKYIRKTYGESLNVLAEQPVPVVMNAKPESWFFTKRRS